MEAFWNILHPFGNILNAFQNILQSFWNILEYSVCTLGHFGTFWNILYALWDILHEFCNILEHFACIFVTRAASPRYIGLADYRLILRGNNFQKLGCLGWVAHVILAQVLLVLTLVLWTSDSGLTTNVVFTFITPFLRHPGNLKTGTPSNPATVATGSYQIKLQCVFFH